jgi:diacylglycerol kinase family enzyme
VIRPTVQLFVNPRAGFRAHARAQALRAALEALGAEVLLTKSVSDRLTVDDRADHVCAVGGDGTLRHVVEAARRARRTVSISTYPAGTVNLLAMEYAYSRDPRVFARRVLKTGQRRRHYTARIGQIPLLATASVGPDSYTVAHLSPRMKRLIGRTAYLVAFTRVLLRWPRTRITLLHDNQRTECEAVYVAKGRFYAGRWSFAPQASVGEPLLHVTALRQASRTRFLLFLWALLWHRPVEHLAGVHCFTCTELTLLSESAPPIQGDGDIVAHLPLSITLEAEALQFA